jgi:hypothetical protein
MNPMRDPDPTAVAHALKEDFADLKDYIKRMAQWHGDVYTSATRYHDRAFLAFRLVVTVLLVASMVVVGFGLARDYLAKHFVYSLRGLGIEATLVFLLFLTCYTRKPKPARVD